MNVAEERHTLRGTSKTDEPMARHTSWRVGGPADCFYQPADIDDLAAFLSQLPADEPLLWVGLGSNLLVRDGGIRGTVIAPSGMLKGLSVFDHTVVRAEVGVASAKVARFAADKDLAGCEFFAGIPGTVGGALAMNAGAFGGETWEVVQAVETVNRQGDIRIREKSEFDIAYRSVKGLNEEWFVAAHFKLNEGVGNEVRAQIKQLLAKRDTSQPMQTANAGSVFKNPVDDHAARLIDSAGLKGTCVGKACVSDVHANFIINTGGARAADIEHLINKIKNEVQQRHGVELEREVRIVGEVL
ncbi:MAG: UDP-N-acetylmuramate dehydrogenase [Acidiferrobacterales bacterium]